jgi:hypothetical protein
MIFSKKILKIIGLYALGWIMLIAYYYLDNSSSLKEFLNKVDRVGTPGDQLGFYAIIGLFKYGLLISGLATILILTIFLIIKTQHNNTYT